MTMKSGMVEMTDEKSEPREFTVVLVVGDDQKVIGMAHIEDFMKFRGGALQVIEPVQERSFSCRTTLTIDPETLEALKKLAEPKPSPVDLAKLAMDLNRIQASIKAAEKFGPVDSIPVPKKYQRNRFKR